MNTDIAGKKLHFALEEIKEISKMDYLLYSVQGNLLAGTSENVNLEQSVKLFAFSLAETQVMQGWIFFKIELHGKTEYILLCSKGHETDSSYVIGRMAVCQIRNILLSMQEPENEIHVLRQIINGEIVGEKLAEKCHQLQLKPNRYMLYVIQHRNDKDAIFVETLKNLFVNNNMDFVVEMNGTSTVLIKSEKDIPDGNYEQYAKIIVDNLQTEAMISVWVGYAETVDSFDRMAAAYRNACTALKIGMVFYMTEKVFCFQQLGIGRLIYKLPVDLCEMFLKEVLGEKMDVDFDAETLMTINKLFENNLNISETARQLFIHRNTLVYRLERIEKKLGLDIRSFEDAMLFKIAMMVRTHLNELGREAL